MIGNALYITAILVAAAVPAFGDSEANPASVPRILTSSGESFETPNHDGSAPEGWKHDGTQEDSLRAWTHESPYQGERALRLSGLEGAGSWTSDPIPVHPGKTYLLSWRARYRGEKIWRFRASYSGLKVFAPPFNSESPPFAELHTSCWQSPGWRPGWLLVTVPSGVQEISLQWLLDTVEPLPGGFDVDAMRITPYPLEIVPAHQASLRLNLLADGQPTVARIRVEPIHPTKAEMEAPGGVVYGMAGNAFHPPADGLCEILVSPGKYRVTVTKGFEYEPWDQTVDVQADAGRPVHVEVKLERRLDWRSKGWISGDHHTHLYRHGSSLFTSIGWADMPRIARSEGLEFLPFMGADRYPPLDGRGGIGLPAGTFPIPVELLDEITEDFWGHVCPIGVSEAALEDPRYDEGPMNFDRWSAMESDGGVLVYAHPYGPIADGSEFTAVTDPESGLQSREFPIDLALGMPCGFDLLTQEGAANQLELKLRDLYRLYNLGFRPTLTASTDFHVDQGRMPIGSVRTYVHPHPSDPRGIAEAYRTGRTFVSNGPLIDFSVNGVGPGGSLSLSDGPAVVRVSAEAASLGSLDRIEIIVNGKATKVVSGAGDSPLGVSEALRLDESSWVAARVYGPTAEWFTDKLEGRPIGAGQFAHTTPVFIEVAGKPIRAASREDADYFVQWCGAVSTAWERFMESAPEQRVHDGTVRARIATARQRYQELADETARR